MNGTELILDADKDTSITADTDDTIHFKIGGNDRITFTTGIIDVKMMVLNLKLDCIVKVQMLTMHNYELLALIFLAIKLTLYQVQQAL